jgi:nucleotide-binding universal stress UspA family protein
MLKMLIAVDGSEHSLHAIEAVARIANETMQRQVVLLNVRGAPLLYGDLPALSLQQIDEAQKKQQDEVLALALERARARGLVIGSTRRAVGDAAAEIVRVAAECGAEQIVIGTHGRGALGTLFLGSVAQRVVHLAEVPVLLVK